MQQINKKRRFNVIDLLICAIILVVIAFAAYIFVFSDDSAPAVDTVNVQFTLEVKEERDELISHAQNNIGSTLVEGSSKYKLGEVIDFYYEGAKLSSHNSETGESIAADYPEHSNLYFVVNAQAQKNPSNGRYSINGFDISVGTLVYVRLPDYTGTSYCIQINEIE